MAGDTSEFWNEMWQEMDEASPSPDEVLVGEVAGLTPGRALEIGCGTGGNAVWLAEQGWEVTALDYSDVAIGKAKEKAGEHGVEVDFVVADASAYEPQGVFDLITSFYIHVLPEPRKEMFRNAANALAPGGVLLFVSHDRSKPPSGWSDEDKLSLTTPDEIVAELPGLSIDKAYVLEHVDGAHAHAESEAHEHEGGDHHEPQESNSTIVRASKPA